jgi:hypothetical protein
MKARVWNYNELANNKIRQSFIFFFYFLNKYIMSIFYTIKELKNIKN